MREILFRGKRVDNGEWIEGGICQTEGYTIILTSEDFEGILYKPPSSEFYDIEVSPETVGQYTGLTDKNGKKIFEGDIVKYKTVCRFTDDEDLKEFGNKHPDKTWNHIEVVKWVKKSSRFAPAPQRNDCEDYYYSTGTYDFEVVGNIYDNPELLKEDKDNG